MNQQHPHEMEEENYVISIPDEDGNEVEMLLVDTFEVDSNTYAVLLEKEDLEADAVILRLTERDGDTYLEDIADDEEWAKVEQAYNQLVDEQEL